MRTGELQGNDGNDQVAVMVGAPFIQHGLRAQGTRG